MKLRTKVFCIFTILTILPILIISIFVYHRYTLIVNAQMDQISNHLFENAEFYMNNTLSDIQNVSELFTFYSDADNSIIDDLKQYKKGSSYTSYDIYNSNNNIKFICQNLIYTSDYLNGIFIFTPSGAILGYGFGGNIDTIPDYSPENSDWYINTIKLKGKTYIDGITSKDFIIDSKPSISFCKSIYDVYTKEFLGVLFIDYDPAILSMTSVNTLPDMVNLEINTDTGTIINPDYIDNNIFAKGATTKDITTTLQYNNLTLKAHINYDALLSQFQTTRYYIIGFSILYCIAFLILSTLLSDSITKPITFLCSYMTDKKFNKQIKNNKYLARNDELGALFREYNNMLAKQDTYIKTQYKDRLILLDAQMKSLEAQINSHFLFNTLESINSIAEVEEVPEISNIVLALGNMFRYSIKTESELVTLQEEITHVENYVSIQQVRFGNRFKIDIDISENLRQQKVLKLILQPLVENAIKHGLNNCLSGDYIHIHASQTDDVIYISVSDNGMGMDEETLSSLQRSLNEPAEFKTLGKRNSQSIGLKNIHSRIVLYYGKEYGLLVKSKQNFGSTFTIKIPII